MNILAIETSTEACAVGVSANGAQYTRFELTPRRHTECVLPWCDALLAQAGIAKSELHAIAVGIGPGAFTGVRLGLSLAQGMALALNIPLLPISTLAIVAQAQKHNGPIAVLMDARMGECYVGFYQKQNGIVQAIAPEQLCAPENIHLPFAAEWLGTGSGFAAYAERLPSELSAHMQSIHSDALPQPEALLQLAEFAFTANKGVAPHTIEPAYLRNKVAQTIAERATK